MGSLVPNFSVQYCNPRTDPRGHLTSSDNIMMVLGCRGLMVCIRGVLIVVRSLILTCWLVVYLRGPLRVLLRVLVCLVKVLPLGVSWRGILCAPRENPWQWRVTIGSVPIQNGHAITGFHQPHNLQVPLPERNYRPQLYSYRNNDWRVQPWGNEGHRHDLHQNHALSGYTDSTKVVAAE